MRELKTRYDYTTEAEKSAMLCKFKFMSKTTFTQSGNRTGPVGEANVLHITKIAPNRHETFSQTIRKYVQGAEGKNSPSNLTYT